MWVGDERYVCTSEGNGPVNAIDKALRSAIQQAYPHLANIHLTDYKVRILDGGQATGAVTRVLLSATDGERRLDDDRRQPEHHRSVVAGARGERRLRPPPRTGRLITYDRRRMSAPKSAPAGLRETPYYSSPDVVPDAWTPDRPGVVDGPQPSGPRLGTQGPDQGYALVDRQAAGA